MSELELKSCPFCGRSHGLLITSIHHRLDDITFEQWSVFCDASGDKGGCGASCGYHRTKAEAIEAWNRRAQTELMMFPSAQPQIIHCCDCIYYDPEHIEKNGVRYEYKDMPKAAFAGLETGLVSSEYGINVGGKCYRDYGVGYSEDKSVFVSEQNYCGRARRRAE